MRRDKIYISTISTDAVRVAQEYGLGLEIAEYCTAWNITVPAVTEVCLRHFLHWHRFRR